MTIEELKALGDEELSELVNLEILGLTEEIYGDPPIEGPGWAIQLLCEYRERLWKARGSQWGT